MNRKRQLGEMGAGQSGVMLLEALIAILIFSLGILAVIGIQATSIKMAADAQLRTRATLLSNRVVGRMWASGLNIDDLKDAFESPDGPDYKSWLKEVGDHERFGLPGVAAGSEESGAVSTLPTITITNAAGAASGQVTVTLYWRTPSMPLSERHQHIVISQISRNG